MRSIPLILSIGILLLAASCQRQEKKQVVVEKTSEPTMDIAIETQKLKDLCILETQLFIDGKSSAHLYWQSPKTEVIHKTKLVEEVFWSKGGKVISEGPKKYLEAHPDFIFEVIDRTDWVTQITEKMAYVTYRQHINWQDSPDAEKYQATTYQIRVFVREKDEWKMALVSSVF